MHEKLFPCETHPPPSQLPGVDYESDDIVKYSMTSLIGAVNVNNIEWELTAICQ